MKNKKETISKGILSLLFSQIIVKIIGLIYKLYLTNREGFGDTGNAIYSAGFQVYALLLAFSSTGIPSALAKLVSERVAVGDNKGAYRIFKIAFYTFSAFGLLGTILLFLGAHTIATNWLQIPEAEYSLITLSPSIFFASVISVLKGYFNGRQNLSATAKSQTIEQIFKTIFTIILVELVAYLSKTNTTLMAGVANLATTLSAFVCFSYLYIFYKSKNKEIAQEISMSTNYIPTRVRKTLKTILKESMPISLSSFVASLNRNIDLFTVVRILKKFMTESDAKIQYGILSGKVDTLCSLPLCLNIPFVTAMIPSIAKSKSKGRDAEVSTKISTFLTITVLISVPSTLIFILFANPILKILFPNASSGALLLQINSVSILFSMLSQTVNGALQGIGKTHIPAISFFMGMIFKFLTNIILISNESIGINGAAIGNIICNIVVFSIGFFVLHKNVELKFDIKSSIFIPILDKINEKSKKIK